MTEYKYFRKDGWPLCPGCGHDELFSLTIPASIDTIVGCYYCKWRRPEQELDEIHARLRIAETGVHDRAKTEQMRFLSRNEKVLDFKGP